MAGEFPQGALLVDLGQPSATAVGEHDGVYVFAADGVKWRYHRGERLPMP